MSSMSCIIRPRRSSVFRSFFVSIFVTSSHFVSLQFHAASL
nr:MAG TPA: hypothetical protein [Caudoviricetes sp.]